MNRALVSVVALAAVLAIALARPEDEKYTDKFDNINVDEILTNQRLYKSYFDCLVAETDGRCTPEGKSLRRIIPDALTNACQKCSDKQKVAVRKVLKALKEDHDEDWTTLRAKWDPENVYYEKYKGKFAGEE